jgi:hypothetical protein
VLNEKQKKLKRMRNYKIFILSPIERLIAQCKTNTLVFKTHNMPTTRSGKTYAMVLPDTPSAPSVRSLSEYTSEELRDMEPSLRMRLIETLDPSTTFNGLPLLVHCLAKQRESEVPHNYGEIALEILNYYGERAIGYRTKTNETALMWAIDGLRVFKNSDRDRKLCCKIAHKIISLTTKSTSAEFSTTNYCNVTPMYWALYLSSLDTPASRDAKGVVLHILNRAVKEKMGGQMAGMFISKPKSGPAEITLFFEKMSAPFLRLMKNCF